MGYLDDFTSLTELTKREIFLKVTGINKRQDSHDNCIFAFFY
jgi:hypothetical protein